MKKFLVMSALVGAFAFTSCASCDEEQAYADFSAAASAYTTAAGTMDCAAIDAAWGDYSTAWGNLCDSQTDDATWAQAQEAHDAMILALGC